MNTTASSAAWLASADGDQIPIPGNLAIGRIGVNQLRLADDRVSRRHALIHSQGVGEYWLVDLGSRNGTYVNDRRVHQPVQLRTGDTVRVGPFAFVFHQPGSEGDGLRAEHTTTYTLMDVRRAACWLLVADVIGSTRLGQTLPADQLAMLIGQWFFHSKQIVETARGTMNKYLGDGFFAFWLAEGASATAIVATLDRLRRLQQAANPPFRLVLHYGDVLLGGALSMGEDSLSGPEVNFVFRMEKLAGRLREGCLLSEPVVELLQGHLTSQPVGQHSLEGFPGSFSFFSI